MNCPMESQMGKMIGQVIWRTRQEVNFQCHLQTIAEWLGSNCLLFRVFAIQERNSLKNLKNNFGQCLAAVENLKLQFKVFRN